jgi:hypothetical protein
MSTIPGFKSDSDSIFARTWSADSTDDSLASHSARSSRTQVVKCKAADTPPRKKKHRKEVQNRSSGIKIEEPASNPSPALTPPERGTISVDPIGMLNSNLPSHLVSIF